MSKAAIGYINNLRNAIQSLSRWESSGKAFGYIQTVSDDKDDYIYEFFCAMKVLEDLSHNHTILLKRGIKGFVFPKKPGVKQMWARFVAYDLTSSAEQFQICLGVKIKITASPQTTFGSDISIQQAGTGEDPFDTDMLLIMDAKYKWKDDTVMDIGTIRQFAQCVNDMGVPKPGAAILTFRSHPEFNANCLFTNGEPDENHEQYCINRRLKQIGRFDCDGRAMIVVG